MKILKNMRKNGGVITAATLSVVFAFVSSIVFAPLALSANNARTSAALVACAKCCPMQGCCAVEKDDAPAAPQPASNSAASSSQQLLEGVALACQPLLFQFPPEKTGVRFSHDDFPHCSTTPLAQGCIQLI
jgi:hypothetical protein